MFSVEWMFPYQQYQSADLFDGCHKRVCCSQTNSSRRRDKIVDIVRVTGVPKRGEVKEPRRKNDEPDSEDTSVINKERDGRRNTEQCNLCT